MKGVEFFAFQSNILQLSSAAHAYMYNHTFSAPHPGAKPITLYINHNKPPNGTSGQKPCYTNIKRLLHTLLIVIHASMECNTMIKETPMCPTQHMHTTVLVPPVTLVERSSELRASSPSSAFLLEISYIWGLPDLCIFLRGAVRLRPRRP